MSELGSALGSEGIFPTLKDPVTQAHFERDGIVVVPVLQPDEARELRRAVREILPPDPGPFLDLFRNNPPELRKRIDRLVRGALEARVADLFVDHDFWSAAVLVKQPGESGEVGLHTDWNMVDESRFRSGLIWLALDDTTADNGGLVAVPGTNRLDVPYRGLNVHFDFQSPQVQALIDARSVPVAVPVGHAAIWDNRLLHGSGNNRSDQWRISAALGFKPRRAQLYHYRHSPDGVEHRYAINREFFLDYEPFAPSDRPTGPHVLGDEVLTPASWELTPEALAGLGPCRPVYGSVGSAADPDPGARSTAVRSSTRTRWFPRPRVGSRK